jgi:hypothetical protein
MGLSRDELIRCGLLDPPRILNYYEDDPEPIEEPERVPGRGDAWERQTPSVNGAHSEALSPAFEFLRIGGKEFFRTEYRLNYLIDDLLVEGQPGMIAGAKKTLKTSLMLDQAIALARGDYFLGGKFRVPQPVRTGVMSGESGEATIREIFGRIANRLSWNPQDDPEDNLRLCFQIPHFGELAHMDALQRFIEEDRLRVLYVDPTYLALPAGENAGNLFVVGSMLTKITEIGQRTKCTIQLLHHTKKNVANPFASPELEDIAWSAFPEWARQWQLVGRRERFDPESNGEHKLWLNVGGSAGHCSLWAVDITEGKRTNPGGRIWAVNVLPASTARQEAHEQEAAKADAKNNAKKERTAQGNREKAMGAFKQFPKGETASQVRQRAGLSGEHFGPILGQLLAEGVVVPCDVMKNSRAYSGYKLPTGTTGTVPVICPGDRHTPGQLPLGGVVPVRVDHTPSPAQDALEENCPGGQDSTPPPKPKRTKPAGAAAEKP